jgi:hypothetical protein
MAPKPLKNARDFLDENLRRPTPKAAKFSANSTRLANIDTEMAELNARQEVLAEEARRHQAQNRLTDPATTAEAKSIQQRLGELQKERTTIQSENLELEGHAGRRELKPGVKAAAIAGAVVGGGALVLGGIGRKDDKKGGQGDGQGEGGPTTPPTAPPPSSPAGGGDNSPSGNATIDSQAARDRASQLAQETLDQSKRLTDPDYLRTLSRDQVANALLLGGPGAALTSMQTSEALATQLAANDENNRTERFKSSLEWETRERGDIRANQTEMLRSGLNTISDIVRSRNAMQGQIMASFAQGLGGMYNNYQQVEPSRTVYNPQLSTASIPAISRNTNLIKGFS